VSGAANDLLTALPNVLLNELLNDMTGAQP
jgi:hypothetical protein